MEVRKTQKQVIGIRKLRQASGMTQSELGRLSGLNQQTVSDYEKTRRLPTFMAGRKMAKALGVSMVNGRFYMQLGVDLEKAINDGIQVALDLYGDK